MEDIKAQQQKLPIDRVAEENIYQELKAQYDYAKQTGYGYRHESDLDTIFRRQAGILAAGGLKSVYEIGTRSVDRSSVIEAGSSRPRYQWMTEPTQTIQNVYKLGDDYYYESGDSEGPPERIKIDPARIIDVQEDVKTSTDYETGQEYETYRGFKIQVKDDPRVELVNKRTNAPVNDIELHNEWREDPLAYNLLSKPIEVEQKRGFPRIHTNYGVRGAADLSFQMAPDAQGNQVPLILPVYRSTKTNLTPLIIAGSLLLGGYYFGPGATAGTAGATAGTAGAGAGTAAGTTLATSTAVPGSLQAALPSLGVQTAATTAASTAIPGTFSAALPGLLAPTAAGAPIYFAEAVPAEKLAYPSTQVGAGATPIPGSLQARLGELGVQTAATTAPATAAAGSFKAALPSLLAPAATSLSLMDVGKNLLDAVEGLDTLKDLTFKPPQPGQQQPMSRPQSQFSLPAPQPTAVGLLPLAERYRRSLL